LVDPFAPDVDSKPPLPYPFWIKPVKAHSSILGFRVRNDADYRMALEATREGIGLLAVNMNQIMKHADLPAEIAAVDGSKCIAEAIISAGRQCTLEGYVFEGNSVVYGIVDSIRGPNRSSFERYQYPSTLPGAVQKRMIDAAKRIIARTGLDDSPFNMEFFWERRSDRLWMLETNARISKSHSPLFEKVEGVPHKEVMIDVALGRKPEYPLGLGRFRHAAKFMLRRYDCRDNDVVLKMPSAEEIRVVERRFPGSEIKFHIAPGMCLKDLHFQDSYSHELADIFVGANSQRGLLKTYGEILDCLDIEIGKAA
jgi:biotin carboxylase